MRALHVTVSLIGLLVALAAPALADPDPSGVWAIEGRCGWSGRYRGTLSLVRQPDGALAARHAVTLRGAEVSLAGLGTSSGSRIELRFPATRGLAGSLGARGPERDLEARYVIVRDRVFGWREGYDRDGRRRRFHEEGRRIRRQEETSPVNAEGLELAITLRDGPRLLVEQGAIFDLTLRSTGRAATQVLALQGNSMTPSVALFDARGQRVWAGTTTPPEPHDHGEPPPDPPPATVQVAPGASTTAFFRLWDLTTPARPGRYTLEVEHITSLETGAVTKASLAFEVVSTDVGGSAHGYPAYPRLASALAWVASPKGESGSKLLVRVSSELHQQVGDGATSLGPIAKDAALAVSASAPPTSDVYAWVAALSGAELAVLRHHSSFPAGRTDPVRLPLREPRLVPRFPSRGHAVVLATGATDSGPALAGLIVRPTGDETVAPGAPWVVRLDAPVSSAACAFEGTGPIALLLAGEANGTTTLSRIDVDEAGAVVGPSRVVATTTHAVLAIAADVRYGAPPAFVVLLGDRADPSRLTAARIALAAPIAPDVSITLPDPTAAEGWPTVGEAARRRPARARELSLELGLDGRPWVAIVDEAGVFSAGPVGAPLVVVRSDMPSLHPHLALLREDNGAACFVEDGSLFHGR